MRHLYCTKTILFAAALMCSLATNVAVAGDLVSTNELSDEVRVLDVTFTPDTVAGRLVNRTAKTISEARVEIRFIWFWKDELNPGKDSPGRTAFYHVPGTIPPNGELRFTYRVDPPLPDRKDGHFTVNVNVAGFSEEGAE